MSTHFCERLGVRMRLKFEVEYVELVDVHAVELTFNTVKIADSSTTGLPSFSTMTLVNFLLRKSTKIGRQLLISRKPENSFACREHNFTQSAKAESLRCMILTSKTPNIVMLGKDASSLERWAYRA